MENNIGVFEHVRENMENDVKEIKRDYAPHRRTSIRICKDCGKAYIFTDDNAVYFITKYGSLPLRCKKCREKRHMPTENKIKTDLIDD